jgi:hypothetical protein
LIISIIGWEALMKLMAPLLPVSGWMVALAAAALLPPAPWQTAFVLAGAAVEVLGVALLFRAHRASRQPLA